MANFDFDYSRVNDFLYYAPRALKIKIEGPPAAIIPFVLNPIQLRLNALVEKLLKEKGRAEIIILKARRPGISTYVEARIFHEIVTHPNTGAFIIAQDKDGLNTIFNMSKLYYEELPYQLRPMIRYSSKKELVFENPNDKARLIEPGLRSSLEVFSANKVTASRAGGYGAAHFSEVAFFDYAEELLTAIVSSTQNAKIVVWESTANGRGNYFHNEWFNAKKGESVCTPIFFSWLEFPAYREEFPSLKTKRDFMSTFDEEELMLSEKHQASPEQLFWRRRMILKFQGDVDKFHQEYPTDDIEAFVASGDSYFKRSKLRELLNKTVDPIFVGEMTSNGPVKNDDGELLIWEMPLPGEQYVLGVDSCGGTEKGDPAAIEVLKVARGAPIIEQVGEWSGRIDPVTLGKLSVLLAQFYNDGMISPEVNNHGLTTLNEIKENYWNIYQWQYFDRFGKYYSKKLGWECLDPDAKVLTADLRWVRARELNRGTLVLGCEELTSPTVAGGRLKFQYVRKLKTFNAPRVKLTLEDGNQTTVSDNHPFLVKCMQTLAWIEAKYIQPGMKIKYILPWEEDRSYEAGRLSGLLDGEGHLSTSGNYGLNMMFTQVVGALQREMEELWIGLGFNLNRKYDRRFDDRHRQEIKMVGVSNFEDIVRTLGSIRPTRLLRKFIEQDLVEVYTTRSIAAVEVVSVEGVGEGLVIGIETDEHTLVVDGLFSHNTNLSTRPILCDYTQACINADVLVIRSEELIDEMMTFIRRLVGVGGEAESGQHDDKLFAFMIALFTLAHSFQSASLLKELGSFGTRNIEVDLPQQGFVTSTSSRAYIDEDNLSIHGNDRDYYRGQDGWLNY